MSRIPRLRITFNFILILGWHPVGCKDERSSLSKALIAVRHMYAMSMHQLKMIGNTRVSSPHGDSRYVKLFMHNPP